VLDERQPVVASHRGQPALGPAIVNAAVRAPEEGAPAAVQDEGEEELDSEGAEAESQAVRNDHFDELSRRIDREVVDGSWRHATEGPLKSLIAKHLGSKVSVTEATCASTSCRVQLSHPEWPRIPPGWMFALDVARASLEVTEAEYDNRAEGTTTLYFKRGPAPAHQVALVDEE